MSYWQEGKNLNELYSMPNSREIQTACLALGSSSASPFYRRQQETIDPHDKKSSKERQQKTKRGNSLLSKRGKFEKIVKRRSL